MTTPIQLLLTLFLAAIALVALTRLGRPLASRTIVLALVVVGIFCVLRPEVTTQVAHFVGVGRGADLVIYLGGLTFVYLLLLEHIRILRVERQVRLVIRQMAIQTAQGSQSGSARQESSSLTGNTCATGGKIVG